MLLADLDASAAAIRAHGAAALPWTSLRALERRAAFVRDALLLGESMPPDDATDELLSVDPDSAVSPSSTPVAVLDDGPEETPGLAAGVAVAGAAAAVAAAVLDDEDVLDEATVIGEQGPSYVGSSPSSWEEAQTFVAEEDSEIPLEYIESTDASDHDNLVYVQEDEVEEGAPDDDPSDAGLISFADEPAAGDVPSYISYDEDDGEGLSDEPDSEAAVIAPAPPPADTPSYVSFDELPPVAADEEEEVTLGSLPIPQRAAQLVSTSDDLVTIDDDGDEPSFSDVGEDALVTIDDDGDDLLGDFDDSEELVIEAVEEHVETFDLMPDLSDSGAAIDEDEVTLVNGLEDMVPSSDLEEIADDPSSTEVLVNTDARPAAPRAAPSPRVTAGLYGNPSVPTIREGNDPVPKAAAVQLNAGGGGRMLGLEEEEEPIEIGSAGDYGEEEEEYEGDGLSIAIQEYEQEEEEEEEEELELEIEPEPEPIPVPKGPSAAEIQAVFEQAQEAAEKGQLQDAADLYSDVVDSDPDHLDAHVGRGRLYLDLGDYSRAMSDFMVAEEIDESSPEPQVAIGDLYFHRKDYRKAIEYFDLALEMSPEHAMAHCRRGISHYYRKNYKDALVDLEKANRLDPEIPNISSFISMAKRKAKAKR